jgi:inosine/xanthosine triphosphatase
MKKVIVASKNPVKINATKAAFEKMFPNETFTFEGVSAGSGVSDQPMTDDETFNGASNRVTNAREAVPDADFWAGLEGGLEEKNGEMEAFAWMVVQSKNGSIGKGRTGTFFLPTPVAELIRQGKELGEADDIVFGQTNSKQANGAVGLLTNDLVTRADYYEIAMIFALIPFKNEELYN